MDYRSTKPTFRSVAARLVTATIAAAFFCASANASPQVLDKVHFGGRTYSTWQAPMSELWHLGEGEPPKGKTRPPEFQVTTSNNWVGYVAEWEIRNSQLYLRTISGTVDGKKLRNESLLPDLDFPAPAEWFSGRIQIAIGDYLEDKQEFEAVLVFDIDHGSVKSMTFLPTAKINFSLNGLPERSEKRKVPR